MTLNEEADFKTNELFFSQTDERGIIMYGNSVFSRVSEYSDTELAHKPHNIIRHPDMPKSVFRLFWDYLKADKPIVAYVKNRAKSGRYYWVLTMGFPIEKGYISIRLKPSTHTLKVVDSVYKKMLAHEQIDRDLDGALTIALTSLKSLGFNSYDEFMIHVLNTELVARHELLYKNVNTADNTNAEDVPFRVLPELSAAIHELLIIESELQETFAQIDMISKNMLIGTIHLGEMARTAATVSENLQILTTEMRAGISTFL